MADSERGPQPQEVARLVLALVFGLLFVAFVIDNSQTVRVSFVFFDARVPLIWVLVVTGLFGAVVGVLFARARRRKARKPASHT